MREIARRVGGHCGHASALDHEPGHEVERSLLWAIYRGRSPEVQRMLVVVGEVSGVGGEIAWQFQLPDAMLHQPVRSLSGGWQTRVNTVLRERFVL